MTTVRKPGSLAWTPPTYVVDDDGKVVGYQNTNEPNNWGRWGPLDERGTANFITPERVAQAASLVVDGDVYSCAIPIDQSGPVYPTRTPPMHFFRFSGTDMVGGSEMARRFPMYQGTDDYLFMAIQSSTQWDALAHVAHEDCIYNGFWLGNVEGYAGAKRGSIHHLADSLVGRGVLLDLARLCETEHLEPGFAIEPELLDECVAAQGVEVGEGDIVLIRTGHLAWFYSMSGRERGTFFRQGAPGLSMRCAEWCHDRSIAALAMDNVGIEVEPFPEGELYPLHVRLVRDLGLPLGELWWLEDLAAACAGDRRYDFFLSAAPLKIANAAGSMLNPIAIR